MTTNSPEGQPWGVELLPCPFCGSRARLTVIAEHLAPAQNGFPVHLECGGTASCFSNYFVDESAAIAFWNTRADLPRATADGLIIDLQRELAFHFGAYHDQLGHNLDAAHCRENSCEYIKKLLHAAPRATGETTVEAWDDFAAAFNNKYPRLPLYDTEACKFYVQRAVKFLQTGSVD